MNKLIFNSKSKFNKHISNYMKMSDVQIDLYSDLLSYVIQNKYIIVNEFGENISNKDNMTYETIQLLDRNWPNDTHDLYFYLVGKGYEVNFIYKYNLRTLSLMHENLVLCNVSCSSKTASETVCKNKKLFNVIRTLYSLSSFNKQNARKIKQNIYYLEKDLSTIISSLPFKEEYELVEYEVNTEDLEEEFVSGPIGILFWVKILIDEKTIITHNISEKRLYFKGPKDIFLSSHTKKKIKMEKGNYYSLFKIRNLSQRIVKKLTSDVDTTFINAEISSFVSFKNVEYIKIMTFFSCLLDCLIDYLFYEKENMLYFVKMGLDILENILLSFSKNKDKNINIWNKIFTMDEEYIPKKKSRFITYKSKNEEIKVINDKSYKTKDILTEELYYKTKYNRAVLDKKKVLKMGGEEIKKNDF